MLNKKHSQKNKHIKIFATIGPSTISKKVLAKLKNRGVDFIRLNLSHTFPDQIEPTLKKMIKSGMAVVIDTEGSQVRTGDLGNVLNLKVGDEIKIFNSHIKSNNKQFYIRPQESVAAISPGSLISVDFDSALLRVRDISTLERFGFIKSKVLIGGSVGSNRAVHSDSITELPPFSAKDLKAIEIAKKYKIRYFTLSYIDTEEYVKLFKKLYPQAIFYSKIETKKGVINFAKILELSNGILIDRGDLSREVPMEKIPLLQKAIIRKSEEAKKPVIVATNILENMCDHLKPLRSEVSDIINCLLDGVSGLVLTKETAVGKYPVETVNVLKNIITEVGSTSQLTTNNLLSFLGDNFSRNLIEPHGGKLVNRFHVTEYSIQELKQFKKIFVDDEILMDIELIAFGVYSPLEGFMNSRELENVLDKMRLSTGIPWTMPILLISNKKDLKGIKNKEVISLASKSDKQIYATLQVEEIKKLNKSELCKKWFGTTDSAHPGVERVMSGGDYLVAGKINLLRRRPSPYKEYELTPSQTRKIFAENDWTKIVGFHSRNPIHKSHEYIQLKALKETQADGLFIHPVIGKKKKGDFEAEVIIKVYELMMKKYYPKNKVVFAVYPTYSRYAGPREAVFTAICRKNYGCSHFIVGRDHTGVGNYYSPFASHEIFNKFPDLGIIPVFFNNVYFSKKLNHYVSEDSSDREDQGKISISGTEIREIFKRGEKPPEWLMRPEISEEILKISQEFRKAGKSIFVE